MPTDAFQYQASKLIEIKKTLQGVLDGFQEHPEQIAELLAFKSKFYNYSMNNAALIIFQNPDANFVASYQDWKKKGYQVQKGQHGLKVLFPIRTELICVGEKNGKKVYRRVADATQEEKRKIENGELKTVTSTRFGVGTVFDISQTDCPPEQYPSFFFMGYSSEQHAALYQAVKEYAEKKGFTVNEADLQSISLRGDFNRQTGEIRINDKLNDTEKLSTLTHELGHALMHSNPKARDLPTAVKELEADCISIMLQKYVGLELTNARSRHFVDNYNACLNIKDFRIEDILKDVNLAYYNLHRELEPVFDRLVLKEQAEQQHDKLLAELESCPLPDTFNKFQQAGLRSAVKRCILEGKEAGDQHLEKFFKYWTDQGVPVAQDVHESMVQIYGQLVKNFSATEQKKENTKKAGEETKSSDNKKFYGQIDYLDNHGNPVERFLFTDKQKYESQVQEDTGYSQPLVPKVLNEAEFKKAVSEQIQKLLDNPTIGTELKEKYDHWPEALKTNLEYVTLNADSIIAGYDLLDYKAYLQKDGNSEKWSGYIDNTQNRINEMKKKLSDMEKELVPQKASVLQENKPPEPKPRTVAPSRDFKEQDAAVLDKIKYGVSILTLASDMGFTPKQIGGYYTLKEHDSVRFYPETNSYTQFSTGKGGSTIDFVMNLGGFNEKDAIRYLKERYAGNVVDHTIPQLSERKTTPTPEKKEFVLPDRVDGKYSRAFAYLTKTRCIDPEIVQQCIKDGLIYEDIKHNAVFVGKDAAGNSAYATRRSTLTKSNFKCDVAGGRQDIGFFINNPSAEKLYICEAPIDALSIMSLLKQQGKPLDHASYLATCGTGKDAALYTRLRENPQIREVVLANDHDTAGWKANKKILEKLSKDFPQIKIAKLDPKQGKDVNDILRNRRNPPKTKTRGTEVER